MKMGIGLAGRVGYGRDKPQHLATMQQTHCKAHTLFYKLYFFSWIVGVVTITPFPGNEPINVTV